MSKRKANDDNTNNNNNKNAVVPAVIAGTHISNNNNNGGGAAGTKAALWDNMVAYDADVSTHMLQYTNLIPDLIDIIQEYTAFAGVERLTLVGHEMTVKCVAVLQNGNVCSGSADKSIKIWTRAGQCIQTLRGKHKLVFFSYIYNELIYLYS